MGNTHPNLQVRRHSQKLARLADNMGAGRVQFPLLTMPLKGKRKRFSATV
jgi:hypothetical protein